jgi:hypothetical protein
MTNLLIYRSEFLFLNHNFSEKQGEDVFLGFDVCHPAGRRIQQGAPCSLYTQSVIP